MFISVPKVWLHQQMDFNRSIIDYLSVVLPRDRKGDIVSDMRSPDYVKFKSGIALNDAAESFMIFQQKGNKKIKYRRDDNGQYQLFREFA